LNGIYDVDRLVELFSYHVAELHLYRQFLPEVVDHVKHLSKDDGAYFFSQHCPENNSIVFAAARYRAYDKVKQEIRNERFWSGPVPGALAYELATDQDVMAAMYHVVQQFQQHENLSFGS
jgi:hypothetical protein